MVTYIFVFILGLAVGVILALLTNKEKPIGSLCVDKSDPDDGPYLFLEFNPDQNPEVIMKKSYVTLKVEAKNYISHK